MDIVLSTPSNAKMVKDKDKDAGPVIKTIRESKSWSQERLGEACGTTQQKIYKLESGLNYVTPEWAHKIASALSVDPHCIISYYVYTEEEQRLLDAFRALDDRGRDLVMGAVTGMFSVNPPLKPDPTPPSRRATLTSVRTE